MYGSLDLLEQSEGFEPTAFQANHYILIIGAELFLND